MKAIAGSAGYASAYLAYPVAPPLLPTPHGNFFPADMRTLSSISQGQVPRVAGPWVRLRRCPLKVGLKLSIIAMYSLYFKF